MSKRKLFLFFVVIAALIAAIGMPTTSSDSNDNTTQSYGLIVGRNVNMVSGTTIPDGDPYLQRQNEPSIAVSSRNPMHLLAGANDYRTINYLFDDEIPGLEEKREQTNVPDAWLGVFKSFDGGQSWISTLIPGFPQDYSPEGMASPFKRGEWELIPTYAGADAVVRAGTNGLFYYSGIAFNRNQTQSVVFVSRFIDNNDMEGLDIEGKPRDSIKHIDTKIIAGVRGDDFIDKSWIGVGLPENPEPIFIEGSIDGEPVNEGKPVYQNNVYLAYTVFSGSGENLESEIMFRRSTDNGETWSDPMPIDVENAGLQSKGKGKGKGKGEDKGEGEGVNQGAVIAVDPRKEYGNVYVAWRQFGDGKKSDAIFITKSENWGASFGEPVQVSQKMIPFEQGTSTYSFRTNAYPTLTVDDMGIVYIAWAQRIGVKKTNIVISTSSDGKKWSPARKAERGFGEDDSEKDSGDNLKGHQFQPSLTFAQGKLMMVWYDQRDDLAQEALGNKAFKEYIEDSLVRHTVDVRAAQANPGLNPIFGLSQRVSRYLHVIDTDGVAKQVEFNPPNYTLFQTGTVPFHGDYIDIASQTFIPTGGGGWTYNTEPSNSTVFHATWVDNRDVRPPGGNWWIFPWPTSGYVAPASDSNPLECSGLDDADLTGVRNQNIYTATLTSGVIAGAYGNTKQLDIDRTFIIFLNNTTSELKSFRLTINSSEADASFRKDRTGGNLFKLDVEIAPYSTVTRTVFVEHAEALFPLIRIEVVEIDAPDGSPIPGGHTDSILLNPDPSNPLIKDYWAPELPLGDEYHSPRVKNPRVKNYVLSEEDPEEDPDRLNPATLNPRVKNLGIENPGELNTRIINPRVKNEGVVNPRVKNTNFVNYEMENPRVKNPRVKNTAMADVVWDVTNEGNTTSTYTLDMLSNAASGEEIPDPEIITQILVFKQHTAPTDRGCVLAEERQDQLLLNITNPRVKNPSEWNPRVKNATIENPRVKNATFALAPGETAYVVFRIWDDNTSNDSSNNTSGGLRALNNSNGGLSIEDVIGEIIDEKPQGVGVAMSAHAPDTGEDEPTVAISEVVAPVIGYFSSPSPLNFTATAGDTAPFTGDLSIGTVQGILDYTLSIVFNSGDSWLTVDPMQGQHTVGDPAILHDITVNPSGLSAGTYEADIVIEAAGASNSPLIVPVTLTVTSGATAPTVTTTAATGVSPTTARSGGDVTSDGGASVTARGVCWSTSVNPTTAGSHTTDGSGTGAFTSLITGLTPGTTYHVRAYATNSVGSSYGSDVSFTTSAVVATVTTTAVSNITTTTATSGGNVTSDGGAAVTGRGVCWSTSANPIIGTALGFTTDGTGTGTFPSSVTGLTSGTTYHVRAYATNSVDTSYGSDVSFATTAVVTAPTVTTAAVSSITYTTATSGGDVTSDGGASVSARGVCWRTSANPTTADSKTTDGSGTGAFTSLITELTPDTTYHVRAYATNSVDTSYGSDVSFTTNTISDLVAYYPFNGNATDESGNGNNGTVYGASLTTDRFGNLNSAYEFDGNDYIEAQDSDTLDLTTDMTLAAWIYPASLPIHGSDYKNIFNKRPDAGGYHFELLHGGAGYERIGFFVDDGTNFDYLDASTSDIALNIWTHVAATLENNVMKIYINGTEVSSKTTTVTPSTNNLPLLIGTAQQKNAYFKGKIDDVRIYNRALSVTEIEALYNQSAPGIITTVVGDGTYGFSGDGGPATSAQLDSPYGIAVDSADNIYIADENNHRIRRVDANTGVITTVAGNGSSGFSGDGGAATSASLYYPRGVALDSNDNLYIADTYNDRIRMVDTTTGIITTVTGPANLNDPEALAIDDAGNIFIGRSTSDNEILMWDASTGIIDTLAGDGSAGYDSEPYPSGNEGGPATEASLYGTAGVALDNQGNLYISSFYDCTILKVNLTTGIITTAVGILGNSWAGWGCGYGGDGEPAVITEEGGQEERLDESVGVFVDSAGNLYVADTGNHRIRRVDGVTGIITTIAGNGSSGYSGDGGAAISASLNFPIGVAVDSQGNLYIVDTDNNRIRKVIKNW